VQFSWASCAAIGIVIAVGSGLTAQTAAPSSEGVARAAAVQPAPAASRESAEADNPVADPKAQVKVGHARFTVLTPLIRMEWSADGKFEDHASFVFLNRRLPVPKFENTISKGGQSGLLSLKTSALTLATRQDVYVEFAKAHRWLPIPIDFDGDEKIRTEAMARAKLQVDAAGK
jgi:hypothetical protein